MLKALLLACAAGAVLCAQSEQIGVSLPVTVTGEAFATRRFTSDDPVTTKSFPMGAYGSFRLLATPSANLGHGWFAYGAIQLRSQPSYYDEVYSDERSIGVRTIQAFIGHEWVRKPFTATLKVGRLASAFGSFPLRYSDTDNPVLDSPVMYGSYLLLRPDQVPCGVRSVTAQQMLHPNYSDFECGGSDEESSGILPVTPYGLPAAELDVTFKRTDARLQITNSSPANPRSLLDSDQHAQWTAGGGYTFSNGLRVGASGFRGRWLSDEAGALRSSASAFGLDAQWSRGRVSLSGEWQRFRFPYGSTFRVPPSPSYGYIESRVVLTPRLYLGVRTGFARYNRISTSTETSTAGFLPSRGLHEFAAGFRPNRWQLLKLGFEWVQTDDPIGKADRVIGFQWITTLPTLSKSK